MKWKILRKITGETVLAKNPCQGEFDKFVRRFGMLQTVSAEDLEDAPREWTIWLKDHGFIKSITTLEDFGGFLVSKTPGGIYKEAMERAIRKPYAIVATADREDRSKLHLQFVNEDGEREPNGNIGELTLNADGELVLTLCIGINIEDKDFEHQLKLDPLHGHLKTLVRLDNGHEETFEEI